MEKFEYELQDLILEEQLFDKALVDKINCIDDKEKTKNVSNETFVTIFELKQKIDKNFKELLYNTELNYDNVTDNLYNIMLLLNDKTYENLNDFCNLFNLKDEDNKHLSKMLNLIKQNFDKKVNLIYNGWFKDNQLNKEQELLFDSIKFYSMTKEFKKLKNQNQKIMFLKDKLDVRKSRILYLIWLDTDIDHLLFYLENGLVISKEFTPEKLIKLFSLDKGQTDKKEQLLPPINLKTFLSIIDKNGHSNKINKKDAIDLIFNYFDKKYGKQYSKEKINKLLSYNSSYSLKKESISKIDFNKTEHSIKNHDKIFNKISKVLNDNKNKKELQNKSRQEKYMFLADKIKNKKFYQIRDCIYSEDDLNHIEYYYNNGLLSE